MAGRALGRGGRRTVTGLADGYRGVVKSGQQVSSDIANFGSVAFETVENIFHMSPVQGK